MRFLVKAVIPLEAGNDLVRDPEMMQRIQAVLADLKPEAAYFAAADGQRTIYLIVNMNEAHEIARIAEPLWLGFEADVELIPVMVQEDFAKAASFFEELNEKY